MAKRLLIMALVAVQSASLSGASLFLCIRADGSVCLDGGPAACACTSTAHARDAKSDSRENPSSAACSREAKSACCARHGKTCAPCTAATADRKHGPESLLCPAGDGCDCTHVQISQPQAPTILARSAEIGGSECAAVVVPFGLPDERPSLEGRTVAAGNAGGGPPLAPSLSQMIVTVAVRTC